MLAFYFDHNIRAALARGLRQRSVDVLTAFEDARSTTDDDTLFDRAQELSRVFLTHDQGFLTMASRWQKQQISFVGLVFAQQQAFRVGPAVDDLELIAKTTSPDAMRNTVIHIPISH